ncbi:hypothetical protein ScalyP_jg10062, partial [Parmales sp. scaly parma]
PAVKGAMCEIDDDGDDTDSSEEEEEEEEEKPTSPPSSSETKNKVAQLLPSSRERASTNPSVATVEVSVDQFFHDGKVYFRSDDRKVYSVDGVFEGK